ncbi:MAG: polysaccharide deacetylase family protein [Firmicutes bacterium]|nr:polysaccharide deacetylase family protein [Bacillota bacterium]DAX96663.1 MAG TPA: polysaccharide deacetylase family sporulation protein PdaB [Caudoviricetes sp.]
MKFVVLRKKTLIIALLVLAFAVFVPVGATVAFSRQKKLPIYSVGTEEKKVAISFDCAWGTDYTETLLNIMEREKVVSTFFMVEFWTTKYPDLVKKIAGGGHAIGTHSTTHSYMSKLTEAQIEEELTRSSMAIKAVTGEEVTLFRPPYGDYDDLLIETAERLGLYTIQWDVDSLDWKNLSAAEIAARVTSGVKNGSIVLFHNNGLHTAEALPAVIADLKEKGFTFVRIDDLIYKDGYYIDADGRQIKQ